MKLLLTFASLVAMSVPAFADHAVNNAAETARAAYRAADDAESLADAANRDGSWFRDGIVVESEIENNNVPNDHRDDTLRDIARISNSLHYSLSDLYRAARFAGGFVPEDHRGDRIREAFRVSQSQFYQLQYAYRNLSSYQYSRRIDQLYRSVERSFSRLEWTVLGGGFE